MPPESSAALRCTGLVKRYGTVLAVDGIDLEVRTGECFGLLGPNGAGKTTTIEILEGLLQPDHGAVEILARQWGADDAALRQRLGIHLQETQFDDKLTVLETLRLFRAFYDDGRSIDAVLDLLGLQEKSAAWVSKLSGGQRQRLAVGCALIGDHTCCSWTSRRPVSTPNRVGNSGMSSTAFARGVAASSSRHTTWTKRRRSATAWRPSITGE